MKLVFSSNSNYGILSYKINDEYEFIAADNVPRDKKLKYRLAITMEEKTTAVELI